MYKINIFYRNSLDAAAYEEAMQLTKEDLQEFNESLQRMISGDTTLVDQLGAIQLVCTNTILYIIKHYHLNFKQY